MCSVVHVRVPADDRAVRRHGPVVALDDEIDVLQFEITIRLKEFVALVDVALPVFESTAHHLRMNVVKFAREGPFLF